MLNFIGIGAQKAGTTWLYSHLSKHPEISFPRRKEYHFWNTWSGKVDGHFADFFLDFEKNQSGVKYGDFTPAYSVLPVERIRWIKAFEPEVKIIFILRNPIDRAWSSAKMMLKRSQLSRSEASDQWFLDVINSESSKTRSDYEQCLRHWYSIFPKEQFLVLKFDDITNDPLSLMRRCSSFLEIEPSFYKDTDVKVLEKLVFSSEPFLAPLAVRKRLNEIYSPKIKELSQFLNWDLSDWR